MARNSSGKWVQRAAATGGGRTYRGQRPTNWYASLVVVCVLGLLSVVWARYEYSQPAASASGPQPAVGTTWYSAYGFDLCGTVQGPLPAAPLHANVGMTTDANGVITIAPKTKAQAGDNATLGQFFTSYRGLGLTSNTLHYPGGQTFTNGEKCAKGTPDAGKKGTIQVAYWSSFGNSAKQYQLESDPNSLKLANRSEVTINFIPSGATIKRPPASAELAMLKLLSSPTTTSTTLPTTATTLPTTATTAPTTATTAPTTATTAVPPTTAPASTTTAPATTSTTSKKK